jgi:hypothetical protein
MRAEKLSGGDEKGYIASVFNTFYNDKMATYNIYNSLHKDNAYSYLLKTFEKTIKYIVEQHLTGRICTVADGKFICEVCLNAVAGVAKTWIENDMKETPDEISEKLYFIIKNLISSSSEKVNN